MLALAACGGRREPQPPSHEFLVAAGDSTFWVRGGDGAGILVRGSPILLTRLDGRFYELYVTDDDRSYFDAVLIGQRVYRRDLLSGDSLLVYEDSVIPTLARAWARENPGSRPLAPAEESSDDPAEYASAELEILDLHGPYLSYEYHHDHETRLGDEWHLTRWGVLDVRHGGSVSLRQLYGEAEAARVLAEGRKGFAAMVDSILADSGTDSRTLEAIASLSFDPRSFTIVQLGLQSGVAFLVPGQEPQAAGLALELDPIAAGSPPWWEELRGNLPEPTDDDSVDRWRRGAYDVLVRHGESGDSAMMVLLSGPREWGVAALPLPVQRIEWLDAPPVDSATRRALRRAFDEAVLYDPSARIARSRTVAPLVRLASATPDHAVPLRRTAASPHRRSSTATTPR